MDQKPVSRRAFLKTTATAALLASFGGLAAGCASSNTGSSQEPSEETEAAAAQQTQTAKGSAMIFINSSRNKDGNTASMGHTLLEGHNYEQVDLIDYKLYPLGQTFDDDEFETIWQKMIDAETIVIGTPVYWHTMAGSLKLLIDRMYEKQGDDLNGKRLVFFCQGGAPTQASLDNLVYTFERVASLYGMTLVGTATNADEINQLKPLV